MTISALKWAINPLLPVTCIFWIENTVNFVHYDPRNFKMESTGQFLSKSVTFLILMPVKAKF